MVAFPSSATKENFICCSEIVFDSDLIASELKNFLFSEDSYSILSFAEYEYTISSVSDLPDSISAIEPTGMRSITLNGISYIPVEYISDFFHAKYVQLIPEEKMLMEVNHLLFFLLAFFACRFLFCPFASLNQPSGKGTRKSHFQNTGWQLFSKAFQCPDPGVFQYL